MKREWTFEFPAPARLLSMNQKRSWSYNRDHAAWRDTAYYQFCALFPGKGIEGRALPPSRVNVLLPVSTRVRRDPPNFQATVKPIVDGITLAGAWPDDTAEWVDQLNPVFYHTTGTPVVYISIEER